MPESFLESVIKGMYHCVERLFVFFQLISTFNISRLCLAAPENEWNKLLLDGLTVGKGNVSPEEFYAVIKKRIERVLIRTVISQPLELYRERNLF